MSVGEIICSSLTFIFNYNRDRIPLLIQWLLTYKEKYSKILAAINLSTHLAWTVKICRFHGNQAWQRYHLGTEIVSELQVDNSRGTKMNINIDLTMTHLPCNYFSIDAMGNGSEVLGSDNLLTGIKKYLTCIFTHTKAQLSSKPLW